MQLNLPIRRDENDPFITLLDRMIIATMFPMTPRMDTINKSMPSVMNRNIIEDQSNHSIQSKNGSCCTPLHLNHQRKTIKVQTSRRREIILLYIAALLSIRNVSTLYD